MKKTFYITTFVFLLFAPQFSVKAESEHTVIAVLPDTQNYAKWKESVVTSQTDWILENAASSNIVFVGHVGDIVNDYDSDTNQWAFMQSEYNRLASNGIPFALTPGNHDYEQHTRNSEMMNSYFPLSTFTGMQTYGGSYDSQCDNTYHLVNINGLDWLVVAMEFGPRDAVIEWANDVVSTYSNYPALLITHAYLNKNGDHFVSTDNHSASYGYGLEADVNDGIDIWNNLVYSNANLRLVVCGHDGATNVGARVKYDTNIEDKSVCQLLSNYQYYQNPNYSGYMLLLDFLSDGTASFYTYSPYLDQTNTDEESFGVIDLTGIPNGELSGNTLFSLSVKNGFGEGTYTNNSVISVSARTLFSWELFAGWTVEPSRCSSNLSDSESTNTTFTMPALDVSLTATFVDTEIDSDGDGLIDSAEYENGTNPELTDSDLDGFDDYFEVENNWDPLIADSLVQTYVRTHGVNFDLFPASNSVVEVAVGDVLCTVESNNVTLSLQPEISTNLTEWSTGGMPAKAWDIPVDDAKKFFRVKATQ
jgi:hypothetical protein